MKTQAKPTLKDIAKLAGISVNSASRALKGKKNISKKTQEKVRQIADKLGYIPDKRASALRAGKMDVIAIIYDNLNNPYYSMMLDKLTGKLFDYKYETMIFIDRHSIGYLSLEIAKRVISFHVSGIITFIEPTPEAKSIIDKSKTPIVLLGRDGSKTNTTSVFSDDYEGGRLAAKTLIEKGSLNLLYYTEHKDLDIDKTRHKGFEDFVKDNLNKVPFEVVGDETHKAKDLLIEKLTTQTIDGIFCFSDLLAFDVLEVLSDLNLKDKVKVIGYDNIKESFPYPIRVSSISPDITQTVCETISTILNMIETKNLDFKLTKISVAFYEGTTC